MRGAQALRWSLRLVALTITVLLLFLTGVVAGTVIGRGQRPAGPASDAAVRLMAESYAQAFALDYTTYDSADLPGYTARLARYGPGLGDGLWNGSGKQLAIAALVSGDRPGPDAIRVVTLAVEVTSTPASPTASGTSPRPTTRWLHLAVPVVADGTQAAVAGKPALVPPPGSASLPQAKQGSEDADLEQSLHDDLVAFFRAYASGDSSQLAYFSAPGERLRGLDGQFQLQQLSGLVIEREGGADSRLARCQVTWQDRTTGAALSQSYRLRLLQVAGQWHVAAVEAAAAGGQGNA